MEELRNRNGSVPDFNKSSVDNESDIESQSKEAAPYVLSYDGEEESPSAEEDTQFHLSKETKEKIKAKIEFEERQCLKQDILKTLDNYVVARAQRGKKLSVRRNEDIKRIRAVARKYKEYSSQYDFIHVLKKTVEEIRGGKLIFNRNKSSLKDALNQILHSYLSTPSFSKRGLYVERCHYTKIQLHLERVAQERPPKSGLDESLRRGPLRASTPSASFEEVGSEPAQMHDEIVRLRKELAELEEENARLKNRLHVSRSAGGSGGDSKNSRGKTPPNPEGISDSPTHSFEDGASPRKGGSVKKMPQPGGVVFSMSINDGDADPVSPGANGKKDTAGTGRFSVEDEGRKKRNGK